MNLLLAKKDILLINTKLAMIIGLNDAVVLQQLSYWLEETNSGVEHDGMRWIYNTHEQWQEQFPFWSVDTVKRSFASLLKRDLIFVKQLSAATRNQTNYYAINKAAVDALHQGDLPSSINANCHDGAVQVAPIQKGKMPRSSNKTETTAETTQKKANKASPSATPGRGGAVSKEFSQFWEAWPKSTRKGAKGKCYEAWVRAKADGQIGAVLAHVEAMKASKAWTDKGGQFIPAPLVYLGQQMWDGAEVDASAASALGCWV